MNLIKDKIKALSRGEFFRNASTLTLGITIAQAFNFIIYPVLGRIYSVAEFALLATVTSIVSILTVVVTGKYESAVITTDNKKDAINLCVVAFSLSVFVLAILTVVVLLFHVQIERIFAVDDLVFCLYLSIGCTLAIVIFNIFNEWCVFNKYFKPLSYNKINNSAAVSLSKMLLGFIPRFANGLVYGDLLGRWISAFGCLFRLLKKDPKILKDVDLATMKRLSARYVNFPKFVLPAQILNSLATAIPVFFIGYYFTQDQLGYYSMSMNVLMLPVSLISLSIRDVLRQKASVIYRETGNCRPLILKVLKPLLLVGALVVAACFFFIPDIFSFVLGKKWGMSGVYTQILIFAILFDFVAMSFSGILLVVEKTKVLLHWQSIHLALTVLSLFVSLLFGRSIYLTLVFFTIGRMISYILLMVFSYKYALKATE